MPAKTYFVVQEFTFEKKKWRPAIPREVPSRDVAARAVERLRQANKPSLAFARIGDPDTGEFDEAEIIASFNVPPEFMGDHADV